MTKSTVIIGCGGFGVKRVGDIHRQIEHMGSVKLMAIDGSDSDLRKANLPDDVVYLVEGKDGGGKRRGLNAADYCDWVVANLGKVPQGTMYILLYSTTGASGSVIGPKLAELLTARGELVINVGVITGRSKVDVENTVNTLDGLAYYAEELQAPILISMMDQGGIAASVVDQATVANVAELSRITAFHHEGLDSADVQSFFKFNLLGVAPQLAEIRHVSELNNDLLEEEMTGRTLTQLSILNSGDAYIPELRALFDCHGIDEDGDASTNVHYITSTASMTALHKEVTTRLEEFNEANKALNTKPAFGGKGGMKY